jgi:hypothetical protein
MDTRRLQHFLGHASITNTAMSPGPFKDVWRQVIVSAKYDHASILWVMGLRFIGVYRCLPGPGGQMAVCEWAIVSRLRSVALVATPLSSPLSSLTIHSIEIELEDLTQQTSLDPKRPPCSIRVP